MKVIDARSGTTGWTGSVSSSDFNSGQGTAIPDSAVGYSVGIISPTTGTATLTPGTNLSLASLDNTVSTGVYTMLTATDVNLDQLGDLEPDNQGGGPGEHRCGHL